MDSKIPGFYRLPLAERRRLIATLSGLDTSAMADALEQGGLLPAVADKMVENVLGTYALPFAVALNFRVNDTDRLVPMVVEEPSVVAAASSAAQRARSGGGFRAEVVEDLMTAQIEIHDVQDFDRAEARILAARDRLLSLASEHVPGLVARGGGPRALRVRNLGEGFVVVHLDVDCRDAMGANLVNGIAEGIGGEVAALAAGTLGLRILTNLCDRRRVRVTCRVAPEGLISHPKGLDAVGFDLEREAEVVATAIENASRFAELDPYRAATHNKGIMNGIDSVVIATGNDYRAVEAGAHAFAARSGVYRPLATWRRDHSSLLGVLELPLSLGIVGGTLKAHPTARLALALLGVNSARELAEVVAATGLASNLSALRALGTDGIQKGHMALHARSVALSAGAQGDEVEAVARALSAGTRINIERARLCLAELRSRKSPA
jgi:hydroxymethylglutaryl-CoA reductase